LIDVNQRTQHQEADVIRALQDKEYECFRILMPFNADPYTRLLKEEILLLKREQSAKEEKMNFLQRQNVDAAAELIKYKRDANVRKEIEALKVK